jgi:outer membrane protein assembly factor BamB
MPEYYIGREDFSVGQSSIRFGNEFGDLEMVGMVETVKTMGIAPVFFIRTGGTVNVSFANLHQGVLYFGACDHIFYAVDAETGSELWRFRTNDVIISKPYIVNNAIYFGSFDGNLYALDMKGRLLWKLSAGSKIACAMKGEDSRIFFGTEDGKFCCVSTDGRLLWSFATGGSIIENAALGDNMLVFGSWDRNVYALDFDGNVLWKFSTGAEVNIEPAIKDGVAYVGSSDKNLYALDANTGEELWRFKAEGGLRALTVTEHMILLTGYVEKIYAVDMKGRLLWKFPMDAYAVQPPLVDSGTIYFGSTDNNLYALDLKGQLLWKFPAKSLIVCSPVAWKGKVYFGSYDCNVYCTDREGNLLWKFHTSRSDISKVDVEEMERARKGIFIFKPEAISVDKSYKTSDDGGNTGQYKSEEIGYTSVHKYQSKGKYGK